MTFASTDGHSKPRDPTPDCVSISEHHRVLLISFPRCFTVREAIPFRQCLEYQLLAYPDIRKVVLDFSKTEHVDSSGLGSLVLNLKQARSKSIPFEAWSVGSQVGVAFSLSGLDQVIPIVENTLAVNPVQSINSKERLAVTHPSVRSRTKRLLDIIGSLIGLAITAALFPVIALAIQLDSPGPILFSQERFGLMGRRFRLWKFRSMVVNAEALRDQVMNEADGAIFKNSNDPRMTRVGRLLRRTSLDELPQFWNVLIGDMSLIGTRPPTSDEVEHYAIPSWQRFDVRPGMSGEWQVYGRSAIRNFEDVIRLDLRYQQRWTLSHDLYLMLRTVLLLLTRRSGAF